MADTHETTADIIAEMRGIRVREFQEYADRLEAAHKREKAAIEADALEVGGIVEAAHKRELSKNVSKNGADFGQLGDAAKLREAVIGLRDRISMFYKNEWIPYDEWEGANDDANSALAAPPRNCDLPEVAKDPWRAWLDDKSNWDEFGSPKLEIHDWLLAPATEKEGGAK